MILLPLVDHETLAGESPSAIAPSMIGGHRVEGP